MTRNKNQTLVLLGSYSNCVGLIIFCVALYLACFMVRQHFYLLDTHIQTVSFGPFFMKLLVRRKSLTEMGIWCMIAATVDNLPVEYQAGGCSFSTTDTTSFANVSAGIGLTFCDKNALSRIASWNGLYSFSSGNLLKLDTPDSAMFD